MAIECEDVPEAIDTTATASLNTLRGTLYATLARR